jgi:hypothetical protein
VRIVRAVRPRPTKNSADDLSTSTRTCSESSERRNGVPGSRAGAVAAGAVGDAGPPAAGAVLREHGDVQHRAARPQDVQPEAQRAPRPAGRAKATLTSIAAPLPAGSSSPPAASRKALLGRISVAFIAQRGQLSH